MRFSPPAAALALAMLISGSAGRAVPPAPLSPVAANLEAAGKQALAAGKPDAAADAFEAALAWEPGSNALLLDLAAAARAQGMQGKALHYYRVALARDPADRQALAGEGEALAEHGALEKARVRLTQLQGICGSDCAATRELAAAIDAAASKAAAPRVITAEAVKPKLDATTN